MIPTRYFLLAALLFGCVVLASGSASSTVSPTDMCSHTEFQEQGLPEVAWALYVVRTETNNALLLVRSMTPDLPFGDPTPSSVQTYDQICIEFTTICGPVFNIL